MEDERSRRRASAVIIKDDHIILLKRIKDGEMYHVFPGGGIEEGETEKEAVIREVKEETNLETRDPQPLFFIDHPDHGRNFFFLISDASDHDLRVNGPEMLVANDGNQFIPEPVPLAALDDLTLYPDVAKQRLIQALKEMKMR